MKLGCVLMAAGESRRFKGNKLAAQWQGKPLYELALEAVPGGVFERVVVVTAQEKIAAKAKEKGFAVVENREPQRGISRTVCLGLEKLTDCDGVLFMTADQPFLTGNTLKALTDGFRKEPDKILAAAANGQRGNPCLFPRSLFSELLALEGDRGGGAVIRRHPELLRLVEVPERELMDVDTQEAFRTLRDGTQ